MNPVFRLTLKPQAGSAWGQAMTRINPFRAIGEIIVVVIVSFIGLSVAAASLGTVFAAPLGMLAEVGAALGFIALRGERFTQFGFRSARLWSCLFFPILVLAIAIAIYLYLEPLLEARFGPIDFSVFDPLEGDTALFIFFLVVAWIGAAFGEEVVYRGFIMTRMAQVFGANASGWTIAVILQAILFGLTHAYQGPVGMIEVGLIAAVLGVVYLMSGRSLWPAVLAHGVLDTFGLTDFYLGGALTDALAQTR